MWKILQSSIKLPVSHSFTSLFLNSQRGKKTMLLSYYKYLWQKQNWCIKGSEQRKEASLILQSGIYMYFFVLQIFQNARPFFFRVLTFEVSIVTNINFLLTISIHCQEIRLWELLKWSPKRKCFDLLSNSLNSFFKEMYRDQFGEFVCGYWGLKGQRQSSYLTALTTSRNWVKLYLYRSCSFGI